VFCANFRFSDNHRAHLFSIKRRFRFQTQIKSNQMVEIDSSDLLSLDELYLLRNLDEEKQKYEDMKEEIKENLKRQLRREKKINELEITVAELHKSRLEERKFSITKKITEFVRTDLDDCAEIKNILKKLADRQPKIQELKLKQKSLDEEMKLIIESDEPGTVDQTKNLERSHAVLSIGTVVIKKNDHQIFKLQRQDQSTQASRRTPTKRKALGPSSSLRSSKIFHKKNASRLRKVDGDLFLLLISTSRKRICLKLSRR